MIRDWPINQKVNLRKEGELSLNFSIQSVLVQAWFMAVVGVMAVIRVRVWVLIMVTLLGMAWCWSKSGIEWMDEIVRKFIYGEKDGC